jgi:hypothetical protein
MLALLLLLLCRRLRDQLLRLRDRDPVSNRYAQEDMEREAGCAQQFIRVRAARARALMCAGLRPACVHSISPQTDAPLLTQQTATVCLCPAATSASHQQRAKELVALAQQQTKPAKQRTAWQPKGAPGGAAAAAAAAGAGQGAEEGGGKPGVQQLLPQPGAVAGVKPPPLSPVPAATGAGVAATKRERSPAALAKQSLQQQQQVAPLPASPGITLVKDAFRMKQLVATLAAAPSWGFSLHLDEPPPSALAQGRRTSSRGRTKHCRSEGRETAGAADGAAGAAAGAAAAAAGAAASTSSLWRWDVLGVAFSVADGSAFYVPLCFGRPGQDMAVRRGSCRALLQQLWAGLQAIFAAGGAEPPQQQPQVGGPTQGHYLPDRVVELAQAARAAAAAAADARAAGDDTSSGCCGGGMTDAEARPWVSPLPVRVTLGLKDALKLLHDPPAASGLPGLRVVAPVVDVRVAAWLLAPENGSTAERSGRASCK